MKNFKNYLEEKEVVSIQKELNEDILGVAGSVLGFGASGLLFAWGGSLLVKGALALPRFWKKMLGNSTKPIEPATTIKELKNDPAVKVTIEKSKVERESVEGLEKVFIAIEQKDEEMAIKELKDSKIKPSPIVNRVLISEVSKVFGEPPIHYGNTGNECYKFVKALLGIKVAQAAAAVVKEALRKQTSELSQDEESDDKEELTSNV